MNDKLTTGQTRVYNTIKKYIEENGFSPTIREIGEIDGTTSPGTPLFHVKALKEKGYIDYKDGKGRTIRILKWEKTNTE